MGPLLDVQRPYQLTRIRRTSLVPHGYVRGLRADHHRLAPRSHSSCVPSHGPAAYARGGAVSTPTMIGTGGRIISLNLPTVPRASSGPSPGLYVGARRRRVLPTARHVCREFGSQFLGGRQRGHAASNTRASAGLEGGRRRAAIPRLGCRHLRHLGARLASNLRLTRRRRVQRWHRTSRSSIS